MSRVTSTGLLNLRLRDFGLIRIAQRFFDLLNTQIFLLLRHNFLRLKGLLQRFGLQRDVIFQVNFQFLSDLFIHLLDIFRQPTLRPFSGSTHIRNREWQRLPFTDCSMVSFSRSF